MPSNVAVRGKLVPRRQGNKTVRELVYLIRLFIRCRAISFDVPDVVVAGSCCILFLSMLRVGQEGINIENEMENGTQKYIEVMES